MNTEKSGKMEINISHNMSNRESLKKVVVLRELEKDPFGMNGLRKIS